MDLLFSKYASPFSFIDPMIQTLRFSEFVDEFLTLESEKKEWEFYLHKVFNKSFDEFKNSMEQPKASEEQVETTVQNSISILQNFIPEGVKHGTI